MWMYTGAEDPTRVSKKEYSLKEIASRIVMLTKLTTRDSMPGEPPVPPFDEQHPLPEVLLYFVLCCLSFSFDAHADENSSNFRVT